MGDKLGRDNNNKIKFICIIITPKIMSSTFCKLREIIYFIPYSYFKLSLKFPEKNLLVWEETSQIHFFVNKNYLTGQIQQHKKCMMVFIAQICQA